MIVVKFWMDVHSSHESVLRCEVNFFRDIWEEIVFLKELVEFREIRNIENLM